jgi:hypothetical protein
MQEGYEFEVEFNGQTMIAVVVSQLIILTESKFHLYWTRFETRSHLSLINSLKVE